jgi:hypothetical protein
MPAEPVPVPKAETDELVAIRRDEALQVSIESIDVHETGFELPDRLQECLGEPGRSSRRAQIVELRSGDGAPQNERPLYLGCDGKARAALGDVPEQVVERPDGAGEQGRTTPEEITLHLIDVEAIRHDQPGIPLEHVEEAPQKERDLASVSRSHDERETHRFIVVPAPGAPAYALCKERGKRKGETLTRSRPRLCVRRLRTSDDGRDAQPPGRAFPLRSRRRDLPASSPASRPCN